MTPSETRYFCIADHFIKVTFVDTTRNNMSLLRSFFPFLTKPVPDEQVTVSFIIDDALPAIKREQRDRLRDFETGNGHIIVDFIIGGGQQFIFKDLRGNECGMFQIDPEHKVVKIALNGHFDMRSFGINNCMMLGFAMGTAKHQTVLIHSSVVRQNGYGYAFHATSGTGKSTQVSMWLRYLPGCDLLNDDNPIIRIIDGVPYIFGSPWSGKTPCYRNIRARLGSTIRIDRDQRNWVEQLRPIEAFTSLLPSCNSLKWDVEIYRCICDTVTKIVEATGGYILHCLPNREAAEVCQAAVARK